MKMFALILFIYLVAMIVWAMCFVIVLKNAEYHDWMKNYDGITNFFTILGSILPVVNLVLSVLAIRTKTFREKFSEEYKIFRKDTHPGKNFKEMFTSKTK